MSQDVITEKVNQLNTPGEFDYKTHLGGGLYCTVRSDVTRCIYANTLSPTTNSTPFRPRMVSLYDSRNGRNWSFIYRQSGKSFPNSAMRYRVILTRFTRTRKVHSRALNVIRSEWMEYTCRIILQTANFELYFVLYIIVYRVICVCIYIVYNKMMTTRTVFFIQFYYKFSHTNLWTIVSLSIVSAEKQFTIEFKL